MPHNQCPELVTLYHAWRAKYSEACTLRDQYIQDGSEAAERAFWRATEEAEGAREEYFAKANEPVEFKGETIITKDAVLMHRLEEQVGKVDTFTVKRGRVTTITTKSINFSDVGAVYFPDGLQDLYLDDTAINCPEGLRLPDGLKLLDLFRSTIERPEDLHVPDELQGLSLDNATINNPENLHLPDGLQVLYLNDATINNPEDLHLPDGLQNLCLFNVKITPAFHEKLKAYKARNPGVDISGVEGL